MTTTKQQEINELLAGLDELIAGNITEAEMNEVSDFWAEMHEFNSEDYEIITRGRNLAEPLTFGDDEIQKFISENVCALCGSALTIQDAGEGKCYAACFNHGPVFDETHVKAFVMEQIESNRTAARMELNARKNVTEQQIMKELGY